MLKQTNESVFQALVRQRGASVLTPSRQMEICRAAKAARCVDYVSKFEIPKLIKNWKAETVETRANWNFILTGIGIYTRALPQGGRIHQPRFKFTFPVLANTATIKNRTGADELDTVQACLFMGCEHHLFNSNAHFEEYKNVFHVLPERSIIEVTTLDDDGTNPEWQNQEGTILFTGFEISMEAMGE